MKNTTKLRKLNLRRETVMQLDRDDLQDVNGGGAVSEIIKKTASWVTRNVCSGVSIDLSMRSFGGGGGQPPQGGQGQGGGQ